MFFMYMIGLFFVTMKYNKGIIRQPCKRSVSTTVKMYHPFWVITVEISSIFKIFTAIIQKTASGENLKQNA